MRVIVPRSAVQPGLAPEELVIDDPASGGSDACAMPHSMLRLVRGAIVEDSTFWAEALRHLPEAEPDPTVPAACVMMRGSGRLPIAFPTLTPPGI